MVAIFPMNGKGERFKKAGFNIPKSLLPLPSGLIAHKVMLTYKNDGWDIAALVSRECTTSSFGDKYVTVPWDTSGPLETILSIGSLHVLGKQEVLIADCDSFFEDPKELWDAVEEFRKSGLQGGITYRKTSDPGCSYFNLGYLGDTTKEGTWEVGQDFREKDPYTQFSCTGPYYWKSWDTFYKCALRAYWNGVTSIAPVYNYLKEPVRAVEVKTFVHLGTPDAYIKYCCTKLSELETPST